jgi:hypothetical protein
MLRARLRSITCTSTEALALQDAAVRCFLVRNLFNVLDHHWFIGSHQWRYLALRGTLPLLLSLGGSL